MAERQWKSSLSFEVSFPIRGKVLQAALCDCEEEGDLRVRVARSPDRGWAYDPKARDTFLDIHAFDPKGFYTKVRPGDWVEGDIVCFGYLRRVRASRIEMEGDMLTDGTRLVGRASELDDTHLRVDFGVFRADLAFENPEQMRKVLKGERVKDGAFVETDVDVDIEVQRYGSQDEVAKGMRRRFPAGRGRR